MDGQATHRGLSQRELSPLTLTLKTIDELIQFYQVALCPRRGIHTEIATSVLRSFDVRFKHVFHAVSTQAPSR